MTGPVTASHEAPPRDAVAAARAQLLGFADQFGAMARGLRRWTWRGVVLAAFNVGLFSWTVFVATEAAWWVAAIVLAVVAVPTVVMVLVDQALATAAEIPRTVRDLGATLDDIAARMARDHPTADLVIREEAGRLRRLRQGLKGLRRFVSIAWQVAGVSEVVSGVLFVANPLFPLWMAVGVVGTVLLTGLGVVIVLIV